MQRVVGVGGCRIVVVVGEGVADKFASFGMRVCGVPTSPLFVVLTERDLVIADFTAAGGDRVALQRLANAGDRSTRNSRDSNKDAELEKPRHQRNPRYSR